MIEKPILFMLKKAQEKNEPNIQRYGELISFKETGKAQHPMARRVDLFQRDLESPWFQNPREDA